MGFIMKKIINGIFLLALILLASIACSTTSATTEHNHDGRYLSPVDYDYQIEKYNELLEYTKGLEQRLINLESTSTSAPNSTNEQRIKNLETKVSIMGQDLRQACRFAMAPGAIFTKCKNSLNGTY